MYVAITSPYLRDQGVTCPLRGLCLVNREATFAEEERSSGARNLLGSAVPLSHLRAGDRMEDRGNQADSWVTYMFPRVNKANPMSRLAPNTDEEIFKRISASTSSYTTESNEDTFKPDMVIESFHHQAKVSMSNWALLAGFLMVWLKRCAVPTLPYEVIIADVVYLAIGSPLPSF